jgi:hypothetical protein
LKSNKKRGALFIRGGKKMQTKRSFSSTWTTTYQVSGLRDKASKEDMI